MYVCVCVFQAEDSVCQGPGVRERITGLGEQRDQRGMGTEVCTTKVILPCVCAGPRAGRETGQSWHASIHCATLGRSPPPLSVGSLSEQWRLQPR